MSRNKGKRENMIRAEDGIASKAWSTRREGYVQAAVEFKKTDHRGRNWTLFNQLAKALMDEKNIPALEKGLESVLVYVENCSITDDDIVRFVLNNVVKKALSDAKPRIKELADRICMALYDRKKHELVTEMLLQGMTEARNSKHVFSCVRTLTSALMDYGPSYVNIPAVAAKTVALCQDKAMFQQDVKDLLRAIYKWNGPEVKELCIRLLDSSQRKAMEIEFAKVDRERNEKSKGIRKTPMSVDPYTAPWSPIDTKPQSALPAIALPQQSVKTTRPATTSPVIKGTIGHSLPKRRVRTATASKRGSDRGCGDRRNQSSMASKMELEDILAMMESKFWEERKEAVEELGSRINSEVAISAFDFGKIIKRLRVLILEDTNVVLVSKAIKCVSGLAKSRPKEFQQHAPLMTTLLLEKFKDKKGIVIDAVREAVDAIYSGFPFGSIARYVALSLMSMNPSVKAESAFFIQRCFTRPTPGVMKVNHWQPLVQGLVNNLTFPDQIVRDYAMKALGTILKVVGYESMAKYEDKIPKRQLSLILKYSNNAEVISLCCSSNSKTEDSAEIDSDSEDVISRSTAGCVERNNSLLPGFTAQAGSQVHLANSSESVQKETTRHSPQYDHQRVLTATNSLLSSLTTELTPPSAQSCSSASRNRKLLSPDARQKLAKFQSFVKQLKEAWRRNQNLRGSNSSPFQVLGSVEEKVTMKLQVLEGLIIKYFMEIRQLSPQLYEELEQSQSKVHVIGTLNQRLQEMERLLKSMVFDFCPSETASTF